MPVFHKGNSKIQIEETGEIFELASDAIEFEAVGGDEGGMGAEVMYEAEAHIDSEVNGRSYIFTWTVNEYPEGILDYSEAKGPGLKLIENFDIRVSSI